MFNYFFLVLPRHLSLREQIKRDDGGQNLRQLKDVRTVLSFKYVSNDILVWTSSQRYRMAKPYFSPHLRKDRKPL